MVRQPSAQTFSIEELLALLHTGKIRLPSFQRGLRWNDRDVALLFDSIWRGYPVGSFLLWKKEGAPAERVRVGALEFEAKQTTEALYVVDGQQRITSLANVLLPPADAIVPPRYDLHLDLDTGKFHRPERDKQPPPRWIPLRAALDLGDLFDWLDSEPERRDPRRRELARELHTRIAGYRLPAYVVETTDEAPLRRVFHRINSTGRPMREGEIFQALFGDRVTRSGLPALAESLAAEGLGVPDERLLLPSLKALTGLDVTRKFDLQTHGVEAMTGAIESAREPLRNTFVFLRDDCGIPHLRLLPYRHAVSVLARFFKFHPTPAARNKVLLGRWLWRGIVGEALAGTQVTTIRRMVGAVGDAEDASVQRLLRIVGKPAADPALTRFDARNASSRAEALSLARLKPRDLETGDLLDLTDLFETHQAKAFPLLFPGDGELDRGIANRLLHPPPEPNGVSLRSLVLALLDHESSSAGKILASHGLSSEAVEALRRDDRGAVLAERRAVLAAHYTSDIRRRLALDYSDHPPIATLGADDAA